MIKSTFALLALTGILSAADFYNGSFISSGNGLKKPLPLISGPWTISTWVDWNEPQSGTVLLGGFNHASLALIDGKLSFVTASETVSSNAIISPHQLTQIAATFDGSELTLYANHKAVAGKQISLSPVASEMYLAPFVAGSPHFAGRLAHFQISNGLAVPNADPPDLRLINFEAGSETWPFQTRQQAGYLAPQPPSTLPTSSAPFTQPKSIPPYSGPALMPNGSNLWTLANWQLLTGTDDSIPATVPGTVLTTFIDRGLFPDPAYGLNNLAIPESLNKQDYVYRTEFTPPTEAAGRHLTLTFNGINYLAKISLNGKPLGEIKGAFIRGIFDVTNLIHPRESNVLLVHIFPPPHPGIPQEQSVKGGPGENGGALCLDGPTFVATEGWDWIPGVRDRNIGIWQDVTLKATDAVIIGDPQVITTLPLPDTSHATVAIKVPLHNSSSLPIAGSLKIEFEGVSQTTQVTANPGDSLVNLPGIDVPSPRLWWPNGYGRQDLYHLHLTFANSDAKTLRFGIREITYELSLMDQTGHLQRVEISPAKAPDSNPIVDVRHKAIIHSNQGWVYSLNPQAEHSPAVHPLTDTQLTPFLAIRVNGVRIAARGGSWGMDDFRKRVSRDHLEPFFKLHHDANLNIIRNWVGQSTEETFYNLADEYGLLVFNDFWQSTQNYNVEPTDTALFLANARDTIARFRNHPSIVLWCGRNEGVPAPALNEALDQLIRTTDGTRYYAPSSNGINLQDSGPYRYFDPADYFTKFDRGFSVEVGIPSFPTLDAFRAFVPKSEEWPPNDTWAYHDWHQSGNGVVEPFMTALAQHYGPPTSLEDFERKAQLMNYIGHRAIFEGMNAHLWTQNSGRMLWMTQPAWPSTMWQILSSDYDTQASYYGVKKASEPVHIQMNLPDLKVTVINNTTQALTALTARARIFDLAGQLVATREAKLDAAPIAFTDALELAPSIPDHLVFVQLELLNPSGVELSQNFYWYAPQPTQYQALNQLTTAPLTAVAASKQNGLVTVTLGNPGNTVAFMNKLTLRNASDGSRVLPAYYSDNYVSLLPGEKRQIEIQYPVTAAHASLQVGISGWNQQPAVVNVTK